MLTSGWYSGKSRQKTRDLDAVRACVCACVRVRACVRACVRTCDATRKRLGNSPSAGGPLPTTRRSFLYDIGNNAPVQRISWNVIQVNSGGRVVVPDVESKILLTQAERLHRVNVLHHDLPSLCRYGVV